VIMLTLTMSSSIGNYGGNVK